MTEIFNPKELHYPFLSEPIAVTQQQWPDDVLPLVSVSCATYMHENFIRDAIEGFLMQQTNFKIEILIHDDASTDKTSVIVAEYANKYPELIFPIYQTENQFSKGIKVSTTYVWPLIKGKYVALCEGDDYWTDPLKLQKQVDFLEQNDDFSICHHNMQVFYEDKPENTRLWNNPEQKDISTILDLASANYISTASCIFRNNIHNIDFEWFKNAPVGDYFLHMENAKFGKIKYFSDVMGVYRVHQNGIWEKTDKIYKIRKLIEIYDLMKTHYPQDVIEVIKNTQNKLCFDLMTEFDRDKEECRKLSIKILENNPFYITEIKNNYLEQIRCLETELNNIYQSKAFKLSQLIRKPIFFLSKFFK